MKKIELLFSQHEDLMNDIRSFIISELKNRGTIRSSDKSAPVKTEMYAYGNSYGDGNIDSVKINKSFPYEIILNTDEGSSICTDKNLFDVLCFVNENTCQDDIRFTLNKQLKFGSILYCLIPYKPESKIVMLQYIPEEDYLKGLSYKGAGYFTLDEIENELTKINNRYESNRNTI